MSQFRLTGSEFHAIEEHSAPALARAIEAKVREVQSDVGDLAETVFEVIGLEPDIQRETGDYGKDDYFVRTHRALLVIGYRR